MVVADPFREVQQWIVGDRHHGLVLFYCVCQAKGKIDNDKEQTKG
jgi:hypothetical protein